MEDHFTTSVSVPEDVLVQPKHSGNDERTTLEKFALALSEDHQAGWTVDIKKNGENTFAVFLPGNWSDFSGHLMYLSPFSGVATVVHENQINLRIVGYTGRILKELNDILEPGGSLDYRESCQNSDFLKLFKEGRLRLCHGVSVTKLPGNDHGGIDQNTLVEAVWKNITFDVLEKVRVARSQRCDLGVKLGEDSLSYSGMIRCQHCSTIADRLDLLRNVKVEPEEVEDDGEEDMVIPISPPSSPPVPKLKNSRLALLKSITIKPVGPEPEEIDISPPEPLEPIKEEPSITVVQNGDAEVDFLKIREDFWNQVKREKRIKEEEGKQEGRLPRKAKKSRHSPSAPIKKPKKVEEEPLPQIISNEELKNHEKKCPICNEPFKDVNLFMTHLSRCNVESSGEEEEVEEVEEKDKDGNVEKKLVKKKKKKRFRYAMEPVSDEVRCRICCGYFKVDSFKVHMKGHEKKYNLGATVACPICMEQMCKRQLNPHFEINHTDQGGCCIECQAILPQEEIKAHLAKEHGPNNPKNTEGQLCPMCGKRCYFTSDLELHLATHHLPAAEPAQPEEVMCHVCGKVFSHRYKLKQHLSNIHNKTFKHSCPFCQKAFNLRHQLTKHLVTHSDIKPFKCKYCEYKNARKYRVVKHIQKAHNGEGTEEEMELLGGTGKTSEFVHNMFGI